jgi:hypothetical protein
MIRYIRAFFIALAMTLRGEQPLSTGERRYPPLATWLKTAQGHMQQVDAALATANLPTAARKGMAVKVDGRTTNVDALLGAVRHHLNEEYPHLLRDLTEHSLTGIYASNLNDQYWLEEILANTSLPASVTATLEALQNHLGAIPPSNALEAEKQQTP